jgi:cytochrome bd-type quinol oxidase subunit 2
LVPVLLGAQLLALAGMVAVSLWGWKHIDPETRTRARVGTFGFDYTKSKTTTLIYAPVVGLLIVGSTVAVRNSDAPETIAAIGLAIMVIFLAAHRSSVRRAAR